MAVLTNYSLLLINGLMGTQGGILHRHCNKPRLAIESTLNRDLWLLFVCQIYLFKCTLEALKCVKRSRGRLRNCRYELMGFILDLGLPKADGSPPGVAFAM